MRTVQSFLTETVPRVVEPVLDAMLTPEERESVQVRIVTTLPLRSPFRQRSDGTWIRIGAEFVPDALAEPEERVPLRLDAPLGENEHQVEVRMADETVGIFLQEDEPDDRFAWRFANDVQDFVAESRFAWGQLRPLPDWVHDPWA
ncbi:hypothetical protein DEI92_14980 [Curtobacterium sp. MCBD17_034]|uniref:hypothetical protein n=1 Tax=unclassified Curtobacterium TaxID=257496 RepID=UPI000DAA32B3|nr:MULTISPECIES: hypothetical protein [unclassified Curtobacterium]PZF56414.1 hypothetical protein DEI92_14980 [Curtobacterium sp. MCBD17_034]PZM33282.1 hypothetical protein DEI90_13460 [Curtobacterium sp. MCBD17_031]